MSRNRLNTAVSRAKSLAYIRLCQGSPRRLEVEGHTEQWLNEDWASALQELKKFGSA